jgi:hypothetical protein
MNTRSKRLLLALALMAALAAAALNSRILAKFAARLFPSSNPPDGYTFSNVTKWIDRKPFSAIASDHPLDCTVLSASTGIWAEAETLKTVRPGEVPRLVPYVSIRCRTAAGTELSLYQNNPSSNQLAFASSLQAGRQYRFPDELDAWLRAHPVK